VSRAGDVLEARIVGSTITVLFNGASVGTVTDTTLANGPGIGFFSRDSSGAAEEQPLRLERYHRIRLVSVRLERRSAMIMVNGGSAYLLSAAIRGCAARPRTNRASRRMIRESR
jgi:hypothetical protein